MSLILGILLACAAGLAGTLLCPDDRSRRSRLPVLACLLAGGLAVPHSAPPPDDAADRAWGVRLGPRAGVFEDPAAPPVRRAAAARRPDAA